jgi:outer membrane protein OmpA-like peptidoglycan-associated protein
MSQKDTSHNEEEALESALSPIVNRLIDENFENSGDKIATQIAPLIGGAIREQIKSQKDDIVDALYPVMGNMISKFVTKSLEELLNKINDQIQNGLSAQAIKRKIKAKIKGVSETELLLEESSEAKIKAALLIHKESGTLLCKVEDKEHGLNDADMLASMMSAIRSFVNEWVEANSDFHELGEIEYGGNKIIIEASGYSYLAVIVEGAAYSKTYEKIRNTLESIVLDFGESIKSFNGSFEEFDKEAIEQRLQTLLLQNETTPKEKKRKSPLLFLLPLLLAGYIAYLLYEDYLDEQLQNTITQKIERTPQLLPYKIDVAVEDKRATLQGRVPFNYHKELLQKELESIQGLKGIQNCVKVIPTLTDPMQVSANIAYLLRGVNLDKNNHINYHFDYNTLTLTGKVSTKEKKAEILEALQAIHGIEKIEDKIAIEFPKIDERFYFGISSSQLSDEAKKRLTEVIKKLQNAPQNITLTLRAYSDMIGDPKRNRALAQKRLQSIVNYLKEQNLNNSIESQIFDGPPPGVDATKDPKSARAIILSIKEST